MAIVLTLALARLVRAKAIDAIDNAVTRYNLQRIAGLVVFVLIALIVVSMLFANWYAAAASLGLVSLVLGFALQTPITSFVGWIYILARRPYREILAATPVDEVAAQEHPVVLFRVDANTWIYAKVRYVVDPRRAGSVKSRLLLVMLEQLNAKPDRVRFPKGDSR